MGYTVGDEAGGVVEQASAGNLGPEQDIVKQGEQSCNQGSINESIRKPRRVRDVILETTCVL